MNNSNPTSNSAANKRRGLGRGLGALIVDTQTTPPPAFEETRPDFSSDVDSTTPDLANQVGEGTPTNANSLSSEGVHQLALDQISPNPNSHAAILTQPRSKNLPSPSAPTASCNRSLLPATPTILTTYWLIAGERRWRAARLAELETVPVIVREASPLQLVEWALVENLQRADLGPLEEANAYQTLIDAFTLTQAEIGQRVGKSRAAIANTLRLLQLPSRSATSVNGWADQRQVMPVRSFGLPDTDLIRLALEQVIDRGLSVRQTEELVRQLTLQATKPTTEEAKSQATQRRSPSGPYGKSLPFYLRNTRQPKPQPRWQRAIWSSIL